MDASTSSPLPLGFGTGNLRSFQGGIPAAAARTLLEAAFDLGIDLVDTAPSYGQGEAEETIGGLPDALRSRIVICSKVGIAYGRKGGVLGAVKPLLQPANTPADSASRARSRDGMAFTMILSRSPQPAAGKR